MIVEAMPCLSEYIATGLNIVAAIPGVDVERSRLPSFFWRRSQGWCHRWRARRVRRCYHQRLHQAFLKELLVHSNAFCRDSTQDNSVNWYGCRSKICSSYCFSGQVFWIRLLIELAETSWSINPAKNQKLEFRAFHLWSTSLPLRQS